MSLFSLTKVLVTGSAGLIGSYIAQRLEKEGYLVIYGTRRLWLSGSVDYIVHCAGFRPKPGATIDDYVNGNVDYTRLIIKYAERGGTKKVIYLSTDVAFHPDEFRWPGYSTTKYLGELLLKDRKFKVDIMRLGKISTEEDLKIVADAVMEEIQNG
jgi:nucleoside-diphosphate-sugar epimerase